MWGSRSSGSSSAAKPVTASVSSGGEVIIVPRNFKLLDELEAKEKHGGDPSISMGLTQQDDILLTDWTASIFGPGGTVFENRLYELKVHCGEQYPDLPPTVRFVSRINLPCVDQHTGHVTNRLPIFSTWTRNLGIENLLVEIRREMAAPANRRLPQPPEGSTF